jgi:hypothetical protein
MKPLPMRNATASANVLWFADPTDRRLCGVVGEHRFALIGWRKVPPRRVYDSWRDAIDTRRSQFGGEDRNKRGDRSARRTRPTVPGIAA